MGRCFIFLFRVFLWTKLFNLQVLGIYFFFVLVLLFVFFIFDFKFNFLNWLLSIEAETNVD